MFRKERPLDMNSIQELFYVDLDSPLLLAFVGAAVVLGVLFLLLMLPKLRRVVNAVDGVPDDGSDIPCGLWPAVSVIVHSQSDAAWLSTLLPMILAQDYDGEMEVIVVNDGSDEAVSEVVARLENSFRNLYMTFAPARSRNLSRRKLAITLGVKAARYDTVVMLAGNSRLRSEKWLKLMMAPIARGKDISVGYGYMVPSNPDEEGRHRVVSFETVRTAVQYLGSALAGRLYRAFGYNLAYRTKLFFDSKGFSGSLNLRFGDDDIFVSSIARKGNYSVVLAPESMVEVVEENPARMYRLDKLRHDFTAKFVSGRQRSAWGFMSLVWWCWTISSVAAIVIGLPSLAALCAITVVSLGVCLPVMFSWRRCSTALQSRRLLFTVPAMLWMQPFYTLVYRVMGRRRRNDNFTWGL